MDQSQPYFSPLPDYPYSEVPSQAPMPMSLTRPAHGSGKRGKTPRIGIREQRHDNQPKVYHEIPSFPSFDDPIPDSASLEEICIKYPNHIRGKYLDAFIQWHWTANDIYSHLTGLAIEEFRRYGIATCAGHNNRANFIFKRLDSHLKNMTTEEVTRLCLAPKLRGCMMDGSERYGASKLQGKYHNPYAQGLRTFTQRKSRKSTIVALRTLASKTELLPLWEPYEEFETYKAAMANHWAEQQRYADQIVDADAHLSATPMLQRNALVLQIAQLPVTHEMQALFSFPRADLCPAFVEMVDRKARTIFTTMITSSSSSNATRHQKTPEMLHLSRQYAVSIIMSEQEAITGQLRQYASELRDVVGNGLKVVGVVHQAIKATKALVQNVLTLSPSTGSSKRSFDDCEPETGNVLIKREKLEDSASAMTFEYAHGMGPTGHPVQKTMAGGPDRAANRSTGAALNRANDDFLVPGKAELRDGVARWLQTVPPGRSPTPSQRNVLPQHTPGQAPERCMDFYHCETQEGVDSAVSSLQQQIPDDYDVGPCGMSNEDSQGTLPRIEIIEATEATRFENQQHQVDPHMMGILAMSDPRVLPSDPDWLRQMLEDS